MDRATVPVLIEVPILPELNAAESRAWGVRRPAARPHHRRRRRLRREIRGAAYAMLVVVPMTVAPFGLLGGRPAPSPRPGALVVEAADLGATRQPPSISISIEPTIGVAGPEAEPPVVFPGYLLPVDDTEEPAHAGS